MRYSDDDRRQDDRYNNEFIDDNANEYEQSEDAYASPAGSLFDDEPEEEPSAYVRGFSRERENERGENPVPMPLEEEAGYRASRAATPAEPVPREPATREPAAREPRRRPSNPAPRPAVRAGNPPRRINSAGRPAPQPRSGAPVSDDASHDEFRRRYSPNELISSGEKVPRRPAPVRSGGPHPRSVPSRPTADGGFNPVAALLLVGVAMLLIITIVLIVGLTRVTNERNELQTRIDGMQATMAQAEVANELRASQDEEIARLEGIVEARDAEIARLQGENATTGDNGQTGAPSSEGNEGGAETSTIPPQTPPNNTNVQEWPQTHVVQRGQSLSTIAGRFYGSQALRYVQHIADANGITNIHAVGAGVELVIPAPPPAQP